MLIREISTVKKVLPILCFRNDSTTVDKRIVHSLKNRCLFYVLGTVLQLLTRELPMLIKPLPILCFRNGFSTVATKSVA